MKVEKEKCKVSIISADGSLIKGNVHIFPGMRLLDFLNDQKEQFIAITEAEFYNIKEIHSFKLFNEIRKKKTAIMINKSSMRIIEEL